MTRRRPSTPRTPCTWTRASWPTPRWPTDGGHRDEILFIGVGAAVPQPHTYLADPALGGGCVPAVRHARLGARGLQFRRQRGRGQPAGGGLAAVDHPVAADPP
ncbi:hypothetical protein G6F23_015624 [Rhizopus arrhizus]|nr:hypothetical protein G6F23_015624 [Rhizopus arrhizus]